MLCPCSRRNSNYGGQYCMQRSIVHQAAVREGSGTRGTIGGSTRRAQDGYVSETALARNWCSRFRRDPYQCPRSPLRPPDDSSGLLCPPASTGRVQACQLHRKNNKDDPAGIPGGVAVAMFVHVLGPNIHTAIRSKRRLTGSATRTRAGRTGAIGKSQR